MAKNPNAEARGFHLNTLASNFCGWHEVVEKHQLATEHTSPQRSHSYMMGFVRSSLSNLICPHWSGWKWPHPDDVLVLTAGVDVQADRFEVEVVGWGVGKESWGIRYQKIIGDTMENP